MYNASIKQEYISYNPNNNSRFDRVMKNYFSWAEESEKRLGKDLGQFSVAEIITMYKGFCTPSLDMLVVINNQFLRYTSWYMKEYENVDNQNHYAEMRNDILATCVSYSAAKESIVTREELLEIIENFANPCEAFLYLALFEGIRGEQMSDFYDLSMKDFDLKKKVVRLPHRTISVSKELIHYAEESTDEFLTYNILGEPTHRGKFLEADERIIKCSREVGFESDKSERANIIYRILRKSKRYDFVPKSMTATTLAESGRIDLLKNIMATKGYDNPESALRENKEEVERIYGDIPSLTKWLLRYGEYCLTQRN